MLRWQYTMNHAIEQWRETNETDRKDKWSQTSKKPKNTETILWWYAYAAMIQYNTTQQNR